MNGFLHPLRLAGLVTWLLLVLALLWPQRRALAWLQANISPRFLGRVTRYSSRGLGLHFTYLFVLGVLALAAAAGPFREMDAERTVELETIVLVLDGSLSMAATDALNPSPANDDPEARESRFDLAKLLATELILERPEAAYALISFSGDAVIHSPPTRDLGALGVQLSTLRFHAYSQSMGSRFSSAFEAVVHLMVDQPGSYQIVLLSDGELSTPDDYEVDLGVLAESGIPVHTVGLGSTEPQAMTVWNLEDVLARVEEKQVAAKYETRRETEHLERMSEATGGQALVAETGGWVADLLPAIDAAEPEPTRVDGRGIDDLSWMPLGLFLLGFLFETLWISGRPLPGASKAGSRRAPVGGPKLAARRLIVVGCFLVPLLGCRSPLLDAHRFNMSGLAAQEAGDTEGAISLFERSAAVGVRSQIPLSNLAALRLDEGDPAAAHELYERALRLDSDLAEAHYGDGRALYAWGEQEIDRVHCRFERTRTLWRQALIRFETAEQIGRCCSPIDHWGRNNADFLRQRLDELDRMEEDCQPPPPPPPPESENSPNESESPPEGEGSGSGEGEDQDPPESEGQPPPAGPEAGSGEGERPPESGEGQAPPPPLTQNELDHLRAQLQRALAEAAGATGYRHSTENQIKPEDAEAASGQPIYW